MTEKLLQTGETARASWLTRYYAIRAAFSVVWVAVVLGLPAGGHVLAFMLVVYPFWDAAANLVDALRSGGLAANPPQVFNAAVSVVTGIGVWITLGHSMNAVLGVYGVWAALSGLLQLATGVRRWKSVGAQWAMILSGAQSAFAGINFVTQAKSPEMPGPTHIAYYAAFGALYFAVSALWLAVGKVRSR